MTALDVSRWLGVGDALRRPVRTTLDLVRAVEDGFPTGLADAVVERGALDAAELYRLVVPRRTLSHRRSRGGTLSRDESDKLARVARVLALAEETLGDVAAAREWVRRENGGLGGARPVDLLATEQGARAVEAVLERLAWGVYS